MDLYQVLGSITMLGVAKVMIVLLLMVYTVFALLMMKQVSSMTKAVQMKDDFVVKVLGVLNFSFAILLLIIAIVVL